MTGEKERVRIVQVFQDLAAGWTLSSIEVHKECREGPFNGGKELAGEHCHRISHSQEGTKVAALRSCTLLDCCTRC